ncbi:MAG: hypothetical protein NT067_00385 [Candidatus Diapherotrites archaeon]|nr:hypothetical protein [Candidatus Diapherotrites archaeon]
MRKVLLCLAVLLLFASYCFAETPVKTIRVSVQVRDGTPSIAGAKAVVDYLSGTEETGEHAIKLKNAENQTLYQLLVYMGTVAFPPYGAEMNEEDLNKFYENAEKNFDKTIWLPYMEKAKYVVLEGVDGEIARFDLGVLCNKNGRCDSAENFLSCEQDCPLNKADNYCLPLTDKICDPDCAKGVDPDCTEETPEPTPTPAIAPKPAADFTLPVAIAVAALAIVLVLLLKRKPKPSK